MTPDAITVGRDAALILLMLEAILLCLGPAIALYLIVSKLSEWLPQIAPFLRKLTLNARLVEEKTRLVCEKIVMPVAASRSLADGVRAGIASLTRRR